MVTGQVLPHSCQDGKSSIQVSRTQRLAREYELRDFKQTKLEQAVGEHLPKRQDHEEKQQELLDKA